jgi:hypothetical protein
VRKKNACRTLVGENRGKMVTKKTKMYEVDYTVTCLVEYQNSGKVIPKELRKANTGVKGTMLIAVVRKQYSHFSEGARR